MAERPWSALPHDPIEKHEDNLWSVHGSVGIPIGRRIHIVRLSSGKLVLMNAVPLEDAAQREVEAWGEPAYLVVPNGFHRRDVAPMKRRYPSIKVLCPPEHRKRVADRAPIDGGFDLLPAGEGLRVVPFAGTKGEAAFVVESGARRSVLVPGDAMFNVAHQPGFSGFILKLLGSSGGPRVTPIARMFLVTDAKALAGSFRALAAEPGLARILVCHGKNIDREPAAVLGGIAARLDGSAKEWPPQ